MKIIGWFLLIFTILIAFGYVYYGGFAEVKFSTKEMGPYYMVYGKHQGNYQEVGKVMDIVYKKIKSELNLQPVLGAGLYFDDPEKVKTENLRSMVGCFLDEKMRKQAGEKLKDFSTCEISQSKCLICEFPYKGLPSIFIAISKVYPQLKKHLQENYPQYLNNECSPIMEIYDISNKKMTFLVFVGKTPKEMNDLYR